GAGRVPNRRLSSLRRMSAVEIRNCIRRLRFENGEMTQGQLADAIGMTRQTVAAIEQGKYSPSLDAAFRIADAFARPLEEVFFREGKESQRRRE
ncbi:MAG: helix-turn-helix transcriptional regulator, partial [Sphingomicrobium sp.]